MSQARVAASLRRVTPAAHALRQQVANMLPNPLLYSTQYFGEKLLDQNEKCVMFSVTHVVAVEGYSRKIVGFITIPQ